LNQIYFNENPEKNGKTKKTVGEVKVGYDGIIYKAIRVKLSCSVIITQFVEYCKDWPTL